MNMNHNEIKKHLMKAKSVEEVIAIAEETGLALTAEQAEKLFNEIHTRKAAGKLDENELIVITGGSKEYDFCKNTVRAEYCNFTNDGKVTQMHCHRCWEGTDYCTCWTETYSDVEGVDFYAV